MPGGDGFAAPVQFSPVWTLLGVGILLLIAAWFVIVLALTRRRHADDPRQLNAPFTTSSYRSAYLDLIDEVGEAYRAGRVSSAEAHQRLSLIVREFAAGIRGVRAPYMTLAELRSSSIDPLADTVAELYPGAFAARPGASVAEAEEHARALVSGWR